MPRVRALVLAVLTAAPLLAGCGGDDRGVTLHWYYGQEASGSYRQAAQRCTDASGGSRPGTAPST